MSSRYFVANRRIYTFGLSLAKNLNDDSTMAVIELDVFPQYLDSEENGEYIELVTPLEEAEWLGEAILQKVSEA